MSPIGRFAGHDDGTRPLPPSKSHSGAELPPGLYLVATPIGNLGDITLRALDVLAGSDVVACEDTRISARLMQRYDIATQRVSYHEHNAARMLPRLLERLRRGERVALVSDAGTPLVSDPGFALVRAAIAEGIAVVPIPGASAPLAALQVSGLPPDRFFFAGFLPTKSGERRTALAGLARVPGSLVFFETAPRLAASLADMAAVLGPRPAALVRELTKVHEEARRGPLDELAGAVDREGPPRGELVIVVGPPGEEAGEVSEAELDGRLAEAMARLTLRDAVSEVAAGLSLPRRDVYRRALAVKPRDDGADEP